MQTVVVNKIVNAPVEDVWASWDDFANIYKFNPSVSASKLLTDKSTPTGNGTRRECQLSDGKNWLREEIIEYDAMRRLKIDIYESSMPVKSMFATFDFKEIPNGGTEVTMTSEFEPGLGIIGKLMAPLMKRQFRPMLAALLDGNAEYVEQNRNTLQTA